MSSPLRRVLGRRLPERACLERIRRVLDKDIPPARQALMIHLLLLEVDKPRRKLH